MNTTEDEIMHAISSSIERIEEVVGTLEWKSYLDDFYHPIYVVSNVLSNEQIEMLQLYLDEKRIETINLFIDIICLLNKRKRTIEIIIRIDSDVDPREWSNTYIIGTILKKYPLFIRDSL